MDTLVSWNCSAAPLNLLVINKVTYAIDSNHVDAQWMQPDSSLYNQSRTSSNSKPVLKTSVLMPDDVQIHRQVLLSDAKILAETKTELHEMLWKYDVIMLKSNNDIGQTDFIKMHIATKPNTSWIAAWLYPLALKHHDVLKQEIENFLDTRIICKRMSPWVSSIIVLKNTCLKVHHSRSTCA